MVFVHRPLRKHWKSTRLWRKSTWPKTELARKQPRPGAWHGGLWPQNNNNNILTAIFRLSLFVHLSLCPSFHFKKYFSTVWILLKKYILGKLVTCGVIRSHNCPQALAEALKVNKTIMNIHLTWNNIGNEGAEAWCLPRGSVAPGFETMK